MTAEPDLLPLPDKVEVDKHLPTGVRIYAYGAAEMHDYARANVARAIAPLQAEIEALRAEVERWKLQSQDWQTRGWQLGVALDEVEARAERLANLLAALDEMAQAGLNSEVPEHWEAALHDMLKEIVKGVDG